MAKYPDRHSAALPALERRAARARLVLARGDPPGGRGDAGHARLPVRASPPSTTCCAPSRSGSHYVYVCTSVACHLRDAQGGATTRIAGGARAGLRGRRDPRLRVPRRLRHGADGVDRRALRRARSTRARRPSRDRRAQGGPRRRCPAAGSGTRASGCPGRTAPMPETRVLLEHIDEPDLNRIDVYERLGGYAAMRKALLEMTPEDVLEELEELGPARPRRRRLLDGQEGQLHPQGLDGQVPLLQRRRVGARHLQGPPADAEEPAPADRGLRHRRDRRRAPTGASSSSAASTSSRRTSSTPPCARPTSSGYLGERILGSGPLVRARGAPRRRAPTSAARRPACSTRSRASAATRA